MITMTTCGNDSRKRSIEFVFAVLASIPLDPLRYKTPEDCFRPAENRAGTSFWFSFHCVSFTVLFTVHDRELSDKLKQAIAENLDSEKYANALLYRQKTPERSKETGATRSRHEYERLKLRDKLAATSIPVSERPNHPDTLAMEDRHQKEWEEMDSRHRIEYDIALADMKGLGFTEWMKKLENRVTAQGQPIYHEDPLPLAA